MARRGAMTAIQAALAGLSGGAAGYVRQKEMQREQDRLKKQEERQGLLDALSLFEKGALEVGPLATRVPPGASLGEGPRPPMAASGEAVRAPRPSMDAIPLAGVGQEAMQQAEAGLSRYETGGPGALSFEIGGRRMALPSAATRQAEAAQDALSAAIKQAEATGTVRMRQEREAFDIGNRRQFEVYRQQYKGQGEYNPNLDYASLNAAKEAQLGRASAQQIARIREGGQAGGGTATPAGGRGLLPSVVGTARRLDQMDIGYVRSLRPSGVVAAAEAPLMMAEAKGIAKAPAFLLSGAMNAFANENEREYALLIRSVNDAVARASEKGVLTDRDIGRFQAQVLPLSNDDEDTSLRKFNTLKGWANWLNTGNLQARTPEETDEEFNDRMANARAKGIDVTAPAAATAPSRADAELEQDRRDWDAAVRKYGRVRVEREYGPRP